MTIYRRGTASAHGDPTRTVVWIHGDHDAASKTALSLTLRDASRLEGGDLVVDLSCVRFMDASTIGSLVAMRNRLRLASCRLSLRNPSPGARRMLELCGLGGLIEMSPDAEPDGHLAVVTPISAGRSASDRG
jgi:anti-anti-sigma factor